MLWQVNFATGSLGSNVFGSTGLTSWPVIIETFVALVLLTYLAKIELISVFDLWLEHILVREEVL